VVLRGTAVRYIFIRSPGLSVKRSERAAQIWPLLALAARNRQTLTYDLVSRLTGMHTAGIGQMMEPIQSYCLLKGLPPLTVLVVNKSTGLPGVGFVAAADVPREFLRVFEADWLAVGCPTPEEFEAAVSELPSNGVPLQGIQTAPAT